MKALAPNLSLLQSSDYLKLEVRIRPGESWTDRYTGQVFVNQWSGNVKFWVLTKKSISIEGVHGEKTSAARAK